MVVVKTEKWNFISTYNKCIKNNVRLFLQICSLLFWNAKKPVNTTEASESELNTSISLNKRTAEKVSNETFFNISNNSEMKIISTLKHLFHSRTSLKAVGSNRPNLNYTYAS